MKFLPLLLLVHAGEHDRIQTCITAEIPDSLAGVSGFTLQRLEDGKVLPVQRIPATPPKIAFLLGKPLAKGKTRTFKLAEAKNKTGNHPALVTLHEGNGKLSFQAGGRPVLTYNHETVLPPKGIGREFSRSGFIHPVHSPSGQILTDDFPRQHHHHQHGLFHAHTKILLDGKTLDVWNQKSRQAGVRHLGFNPGETYSGPVLGGFTARFLVEDIRKPDKPHPLLHEQWRVQVQPRQDVFLFDIEISQTSAMERGIEIKKHHYGGMAIRGPEDWTAERPGVGILTSEGRDRIAGNHSQPEWVDIHGPVDGQPGGIAVIAHPSSFRHPQHVRLHPKMPYFCFAPMVAGNYHISHNKPQVSRYRYIAHTGKPDPTLNNRVKNDFYNPPRVTFKIP